MVHRIYGDENLKSRSIPRRATLVRMSQSPVATYYVSCREEGCWVLFNPKPPLPLSLACRFHGHLLVVDNVKQGNVTEFEAEQGWTKQRPD
jgi:hypothetical protein